MITQVRNVTTGPQPGSPGRPRDLVLSQTLSAVRLSWTNSNSGKGPLLGYYIESRPKGRTPFHSFSTSTFCSFILNSRSFYCILIFTLLLPQYVSPPPIILLHLLHVFLLVLLLLLLHLLLHLEGFNNRLSFPPTCCPIARENWQLCKSKPSTACLSQTTKLFCPSQLAPCS